VERIKPLVVAAVNQVQHGSTCFAAVGVIGDICRQLQGDSAPYCNEFMDVLLRALTADDVARSVKPAVLSAFNDMALALGAYKTDKC
jgi:importin subunit beta-1